MTTYRPCITGSRHMVSAGHYSAAHAGFQILEAGGNAVDAGVAAGIVLSVLQTDRVNFAGVAPIMIYLADAVCAIRVNENTGLLEAGADPRRPCYAVGV